MFDKFDHYGKANCVFTRVFNFIGQIFQEQPFTCSSILNKIKEIDM